MGRAGEAGGDFGKEGLENLEEKKTGERLGDEPGEVVGERS